MRLLLQGRGRDAGRCASELLEQIPERERVRKGGALVTLGECALQDCPAEPPWQERRPSWAIDALPEERDLTLQWLAWFYGMPEAALPGSPPLPPRWCVRLVSQTLRFRVESGAARFGYYPSSTAEYSSMADAATALSCWRREFARVVVDIEDVDHYVDVQCWVRPEFVTLALSRAQKRGGGSVRRRLVPSRRGGDEQSGQFGVIPIDMDVAGGLHAQQKAGLRLPDRAEAESLLRDSGLPWCCPMETAGGLYAYLKLPEPIVFEDDPIRAVEILKGPQQKVIDLALQRGLHVDLAYKSATSICRVPHTFQAKYLWGGAR
jgi:hypothetical protein